MAGVLDIGTPSERGFQNMTDRKIVTNFAPPPEPSELGRELLEIEAELMLLNRRRAEIYQRSLKAAEDEKACIDAVANAMLSGPLSAKNEITWPIDVNGVAWADEPAAFQRMRERAWVKLALKKQPEYSYLGLHLADIATAVQARYGSEKLLHLSHAGHVPAYWCPAIARVVLPAEATVSVLSGPDELTDLYGPEAVHPWHAFAWEDLSADRSDDERPLDG
jgi:hypothetical protein